MISFLYTRKISSYTSIPGLHAYGKDILGWIKGLVPETAEPCYPTGQWLFEHGLWNTAYTLVGSCQFVFGGYDGVSHHNTVFKHTFQWEWVQVSNLSSGPQKKHGCRMVSYGDNQLVAFAGYTNSGDTDEVHVFDLDKGEYSLCTKCSGSLLPVCVVHILSN